MSFPVARFTKTYHTTSYPAISPTNQSISATGKNIVITGGGTGIGARTALSFAQAHASSITLLGRRLNLLKDSAAAITAQFPEVNMLALEVDILDVKALEEVFGRVKEKFGKVDVLISNAGFLSTPGSIMESDQIDWWRSFEVNVLGTFNVVRAFKQVAAKESTFINVSSCVGHLPAMTGVSAYAASKVSNAKLVEYIGFEFGGSEMRVVSVQPGVVETDMGIKGRGGKGNAMDDVSLPADFILWLASKEASFLHGRFVWSNWDVEELMRKREEIELNPNLLTIGLEGALVS